MGYKTGLDCDIGDKKFDVDRDLLNYFNEVEKVVMSIFDEGLPKCKEYFLHKFSKRVPAGMKAVNYNCKGNETQWDEVKPCSVGIAITWLAKFHPNVVKARGSEIKYYWADLPLFCSEDSKGYSQKEIRRFLLDSVVIDCQSEMFHNCAQGCSSH